MMARDTDQVTDVVWTPDSRLWRQALAGRPDDRHEGARELLRRGLRDLRDGAGVLAEHIKHDLPEFTVHDVSHLDALWPLADMIAGEELELTPSEGYVFGAAILLHDLGLALAAYPGGRAGLRSEPGFDDAVAL